MVSLSLKQRLLVLMAVAVVAVVIRLAWHFIAPITANNLSPAERAAISHALGLNIDYSKLLTLPEGQEQALLPGAVMMMVHPQWQHPRERRQCFFNHSMDALQALWAPRNPYPVYLLVNPAWSSEAMAEVQQRWPRLNLTFLDVLAYFPAVPHFSQYMHPITKKYSLNYRHMCAFAFYKFLSHSVLAQHRYLMRLDDDTCLLPANGMPMPDLFHEMAVSQSSYAYRSAFLDPKYVTEGLRDFAVDYMTKHGLPWTNPELALHEASIAPMVSAFATNWEIIDTLAYRTAPVLAFIQAVHASGMIYRARWGDAPLRHLLAQMFWSPKAVRRMCEVDYQHGDWARLRSCNASSNDNPILRHDLLKP